MIDLWDTFASLGRLEQVLIIVGVLLVGYVLMAAWGVSAFVVEQSEQEKERTDGDSGL